ncbi:MAG: acetyl-CoA carboxylase biotin carboxylase subunit [Puniceicoccales bacterium]|jgi:acetyl-CoA carboxylase biotin carboxylase subunit|nr:acetyl-CoA carboxylase biotin carboxylase subunit [Puniceicoccales bacterium]
MIRKVLIANRGEIALRVVRACRELGMKTLAIYSEVDEQSLHVQLADEAICIGPAPAIQSYLKTDRILSAAELGDADAIHPGYGFLAENPTFAEQCEACNIKFIGPSSNTIRKMGDKVLARKIAIRANVPTVPGSEDTILDEKTGLKVASSIGYPVIIKAAAGGGGKGMRIAHSTVAFSKEFRTAQTEAEKAFNNGAVYVEKYIEEPHHVEFQILGDRYGNIVHLGERDCSVQRRYQKLIEEAPATFLSDALRTKMSKAAVKLAKACDYEGAGTLEFLVDKYGSFYFIEMNTRIQVEHTVTEEAMGVDLVKWQLRIANGERLTLEQKHVQCRKHAIECRINAEDSEKNFVPCPGNIDLYYAPGGYGVRVDSHVYGGYSIPPYYDSMVGKLIVSADTREEAIERMHRALNEYIIRGIKTTIPLCKKIMQDPSFRIGNVTTKYVETFFNRTAESNPETIKIHE